MDPAAPRIEIRNRSAAIGWAFMAAGLVAFAYLTWSMLRDGPTPSQPAWVQHVAIALFWLIGLPSAAFLFRQPCTHLAVAADGTLRLTSRSPFGTRQEAFPTGSIAAVENRPGTDTDGDAYWRCVIFTKDGRERLLREGRRAREQDRLARQLREALGLPP